MIYKLEKIEKNRIKKDYNINVSASLLNSQIIKGLNEEETQGNDINGSSDVKELQIEDFQNYPYPKYNEYFKNLIQCIEIKTFIADYVYFTKDTTSKKLIDDLI